MTSMFDKETTVEKLPLVFGESRIRYDKSFRLLPVGRESFFVYLEEEKVVRKYRVIDNEITLVSTRDEDLTQRENFHEGHQYIGGVLHSIQSDDEGTVITDTVTGEQHTFLGTYHCGCFYFRCDNNYYVVDPESGGKTTIEQLGKEPSERVSYYDGIYGGIIGFAALNNYAVMHVEELDDGYPHHYLYVARSSN